MTRITDELAQFIADNSAAGIPARIIAQAIGKSINFVYLTLKKNKVVRKLYGEACVRETRKRLERVSPEWWLERVHPEFRVAKSVELQGNLVLQSLSELKRRLEEDEQKKDE